jgi:hypothetical protein
MRGKDAAAAGCARSLDKDLRGNEKVARYLSE